MAILGANVGTALDPNEQTQTAPNFGEMVTDAYKSIGRTGFGTDASNIDQAGYDYWLNALESGASTPEAFQRNFNTAVTDYLQKKPTDAVSGYVADYLTDPTQNSTSALAGSRDAANVLVNNLYSSVGRIDPSLIDEEGRNYWANEIASKGLDAVAPAFADSAVRAYSSFLDNPDTDPNAQMLRTGFSNLANAGISSAFEDKSLTLDEAAQIRNFAKTYGVTPEELAKYVSKGDEVVPGVFGFFDKGVQGLVSKALDPTTSEADKARIQLGLMQKYGLTYDDLAKYSGGIMTADQASAFLDPIKNYGQNFLSQLRGEQYVGADKLAEYLTSNATARELYKGQQPYFDALAATKSGAATPEQIAAIAKYLGYTNGWNDPNVVANDPGTRDRFVGKPITEFITYAATRVPGGPQGGPLDLKEKVGKLLSPLYNSDVDERTAEEFVRAVASGEIDEDTARSVGVYKNWAQEQVKNFDDPLISLGEDQYRASQLRQMGYPEEWIQAQLGERKADKTPQYVRDPISGQWIAILPGEEGAGGFNWQGIYSQLGGHLGGPDGTKKVGVATKNDYVLDPKTGEVVFRPGMTGYGTSSFWQDVLPIALTIGSFIPGIAPFAQAANAAMAIDRGDYLSGIASVLGMSMPGAEAVAGLDGVAKAPTIAQTLGVPSGVTNAINLGNAIQNKDLLGILTQGAGTAGVDLKGLDLGGISVDKLLQGIGAIQALESGNYGALLGAAGRAFDVPELSKASQAIRVAQGIASGNPYAVANAARILNANKGEAKAEGGLLSDTPSDGKVPTYYSGVAALLPAGQEMIHG